MVQTNDQVLALNRSQLEATLKFAEITSDAVEKLADLQFKVAKSAFAEGVRTAKQLGAVKDASELAALGGSLSQPTWEKAQAYAKSIYDVASTTQAEITSLLERQLGELHKNVVGVLDGALKNAPPGSEGAVAAVKSVIQSASAVYESVFKATKQMAAIAESNATTAASAVAAARKKAA
jgi:phasin family protein